jgi:hypothetical protein
MPQVPVAVWHDARRGPDEGHFVFDAKVLDRVVELAAIRILITEVARAADGDWNC